MMTILLFGDKARRINFVKGDKELEQTILAIRTVVMEIIDERIAGKGR